MSLKLDKQVGEQVLREQASRALHDEGPPVWVERFKHLSEACEAHEVRTHIAFVGTAVLAKATDRNVDPFSIKASSTRPGAYSARGFGHPVLVGNAAELGIDLGTRGREPLNNQPYFRSSEVSSDMPIKESTRPALTVVMEVLADLSRVSSEDEARDVLRAFISVRRAYQRKYPPADHGPLNLSATEFADRLAAFVSVASEGGRRAQAAAAGLLAAHYGASRVVSQRVNDPDRHLPGDVGVIGEATGSQWEVVLEVRDKPVTPSDLRIFAEKALEAGARRAAMLAVAQPTLIDVREQLAFAAAHGLVLLLLDGWNRLVETQLFWSQQPVGEVIDRAHSAIYEQLIAIEASVAAVEEWNALRRG